MHDHDLRKNIYKIAIIFFSLFIVLIFYITYLQFIQSGELANHALNKRNDETSNKVQRGSIYDKNNKKLAYTVKNSNGEFQRVYPFGASFAHLVGYHSKRIGNTGVEDFANDMLNGMNHPFSRLGAVQHLFMPSKGNHINLTVDAKIQLAAYEALGNHLGAIVVLNPKTGAILAMVSKPSFDPNHVEQEWESMKEDTTSSLLPRASQGLYPPGSILKIMIAEAALTEKLAKVSDTYLCPGFIKISGDYTLFEDNETVHGTVNLPDALTVSCNATFANLALKLGARKLENTFNRFGIHENFHNEVTEAMSMMPDFKNSNDGDLAQVGIGQSSLLVTPLRMALLAGIFANEGRLMKPYFINEIIADNGDRIKKYAPEKVLDVTSKETAQAILDAMKNVVNQGTATNAAITGVDIAGKTGTAENSAGKPHAWFIGTMASNHQDVAIAVIIENGGGGRAVAAPIARKVMLAILNEEVMQ